MCFLNSSLALARGLGTVPSARAGDEGERTLQCGYWTPSFRILTHFSYSVSALRQYCVVSTGTVGPEGSVAFGHISVTSSVPNLQCVSEKQKWALPSGRKGDEKLGDEIPKIPARVWMKDPYPVQDRVTGTDALWVWQQGEGCTL